MAFRTNDNGLKCSVFFPLFDLRAELKLIWGRLRFSVVKRALVLLFGDNFKYDGDDVYGIYEVLQTEL